MKHNIILTALILSLGFSLMAMQMPSSSPLNNSGDRIELLNADSLVGTTDTEQGLTRAYEGKVSFRQGDINVHCSKAFHNITANNAELIGNVLIIQQDMRLNSPKVFYDGVTGVAQSFQHIRIIDKNVQLDAQKGYYSTQNHIANFYGNCKISDDTVTILSDSIEYNRRTLFSKAFGNVKIEDDSSIVYANSIEHQRRTRDTKAYGSVIVQGKYSGTYLTADSIENSVQSDYIVARSNPILFKIDSTEQKQIELDTINNKLDTLANYKYDTLSIASDLMESIKIEGEQRYLFKGKAEVNKSDIQAKADNMIYYKDRGVIYMTGNPCVWFDSTQIIADTITIYAKENKLQRIIAEGTAFATIKNDTVNPEKINQLMGKAIHIEFVNDTINLINAIGDAKSLMFMESEKGSEGANRTSADTIRIYFELGELSEFIGLGGIVGEALPENMVAANPKEYYLPNYKRIDAKPEKKYLKNKNK